MRASGAIKTSTKRPVKSPERKRTVRRNATTRRNSMTVMIMCALPEPAMKLPGMAGAERGRASAKSKMEGRRNVEDDVKSFEV